MLTKNKKNYNDSTASELN